MHCQLVYLWCMKSHILVMWKRYTIVIFTNELLFCIPVMWKRYNIVRVTNMNYYFVYLWCENLVILWHLTIWITILYTYDSKTFQFCDLLKSWIAILYIWGMINVTHKWLSHCNMRSTNTQHHISTSSLFRGLGWEARNEWDCLVSSSVLLSSLAFACVAHTSEWQNM